MKMVTILTSNNRGFKNIHFKMNKPLFLFVIHFICLVYCAPENVTNCNSTIKELENKEKRVLKKIKIAIEDALTYLKLTNDSDAVEGSLYMGYLKEHIQNLQGTNNETGVTVVANSTTMNDMIELDTDNITQAFNSSGRRKLSISYKHKDNAVKETIVNLAKNKVSSKGKIINKLGDIEVPKKVLKQLKNKQEVEKKLAVWLAQKEKEQELIRKYKLKKQLKELNKEKCPDFGLEKKSTKYPCCRKCCKSSYLGCLK